jgi:hypothetical protein
MDWVDPTVYVPYRVKIELAGPMPDPQRPDGLVDELDRPADHVTLTPGFVFVGDPGGHSVNIAVEQVRSLQVVVTDPPADYERLRQRYPNAYDAWDGWTLDRLVSRTRPQITLGELANYTGRPPAHLVAKSRELGCDLAENDGDADGPPPRSADGPMSTYAHPFSTGHYLVHVVPPTRTSRRSKTADVLARHDVWLEDVYRIGDWGFAAHLAREELTQELAADPDVLRIEPDTDHRLAPHRRFPADQRVPNAYILRVRRTSHPRTVAAEAGVVPDRILHLFNWFSANLTDTQLLILRRNPEIIDVEDDAVFAIDD